MMSSRLSLLVISCHDVFLLQKSSNSITAIFVIAAMPLNALTSVLKKQRQVRRCFYDLEKLSHFIIPASNKDYSPEL